MTPIPYCWLFTSICISVSLSKFCIYYPCLYYAPFLTLPHYRHRRTVCPQTVSWCSDDVLSNTRRRLCLSAWSSYTGENIKGNFYLYCKIWKWRDTNDIITVVIHTRHGQCTLNDRLVQRVKYEHEHKQEHEHTTEHAHLWDVWPGCG